MTDALRHFLFGPAPIAWVQQTVGPGWPGVFQAVSLLGIAWGVVLALGLALWLRGRETAYSLAGLVVVQGLFSVLLNLVFDTPRPSGPSIIRYEYIELGSFPSGHLFTTALVWGWLAVRRLLPWPAAAAVVLAVAVSRLYLGVHFVGDLLGSLVFAAGILRLYARAWPRLYGWLQRRPPRFFTALATVAVAAAVVSVTVLFADNPYVWNAAGVMAAAGVALPLEARRVRLEPSREHGARRVLVGAAGLLPPLGVWWAVGEEAVHVVALCTAAATLWALLAAPALFRRVEGGAAAR